MQTENSAAIPPTVNHRSHMKRPSSTFCIQSKSYSYPDSCTTSTSSSIECDDDEQMMLQPVLKRRSLRRPWTNAEQESLYVAVERLKLFGRWGEVKTRMNLDRMTSEIEEEYNRLYAEIPDSEDDGEEDDDDDEDDDEGGYSREVLIDDAQDPDGTLSTPALTATSSAAQSTHSSQENLSSLFGMAKAATQHLNQSLLDQRRPPPPLLEQEDEYDEGYEDYEDHQQQQRQQPQQQDQQSNCTAIQHHQPTPSYSRPARMVRVWTPEQSENLKNLVEVYFPGAYRINWVWVAAQMGNAFTRKQCKNKWEIMRRRMGTEDEINLLKRGYQEFGPSWGQIQEKYLPERSRGGISIMWDLLETREAEQQQQPQQHLQQPGVGSGVGLGAGPGVNGNGGGGGGGGVSGMMMMQGPGSAARGSSSHHRRNSSLSSVKSSLLRVNISKDSTTGNSHRQRTSTGDIDAMDLSSPTTALYTLTEEMSIGADSRYRSNTTTSRPPQHHQYHQHRKSASVSSMTSVGRHGRHGSDVSLRGDYPSEWLSSSSSDRMMPMTWTEPLTRRLQDLVREHFPNHPKVNWVTISSLMGTNPVVSKDQCKRRWYLISQNQSLNSNQHQQQVSMVASSQLEYRHQQQVPSDIVLA
ncbi:hypothetical protein BGX33_001469 [Mortierella sp. NVP41]|nr:hypothetical protein BGX33_001469 [Mortierella sp. NVP41]